MDGHGLSRYKNGPDEHGRPGKGCRCDPCTAANSAYNRHRDRMIAYGRWLPAVDAAGSRRRLQALIWNGWSLSELSARLGYSRQALRCKLGNARITPQAEARVRALYDELWNQPAPDGTRYEKTARNFLGFVHVASIMVLLR